jgi:hypothetical protein
MALPLREGNETNSVLICILVDQGWRSHDRSDAMPHPFAADNSDRPGNSA